MNSLLVAKMDTWVLKLLSWIYTDMNNGGDLYAWMNLMCRSCT